MTPTTQPRQQEQPQRKPKIKKARCFLLNSHVEQIQSGCLTMPSRPKKPRAPDVVGLPRPEERKPPERPPPVPKSEKLNLESFGAQRPGGLGLGGGGGGGAQFCWTGLKHMLCLFWLGGLLIEKHGLQYLCGGLESHLLSMLGEARALAPVSW